MTARSVADQGVPPRRRHTLWVLAGVPTVLLVFGLVGDLLLGLPLTQNARSPFAWIIGVAALGALHVLSEVTSGSIDARDSVHHPIWKRLTHLVALLLTWGLLVAAVWYVISLATQSGVSP